MSTVLAQYKLHKAVGTQVLKKAMDMSEQQGQFINETISTASVPQTNNEPHLGKYIDIRL